MVISIFNDLCGKSTDLRGSISTNPCVILDSDSALFIAKGWKWYRKIVWVKDWKKARIFQNSAGAKNAVPSSRHVKNDLVVVKLDLVAKYENDIKELQNNLRLNATKEFVNTFPLDM